MVESESAQEVPVKKIEDEDDDDSAELSTRANMDIPEDNEEEKKEESKEDDESNSVQLVKGDVQGAEVGSYLRKRITEEQFDAFCIDCQNNRSSHVNVSFGTFICEECSKIHEASFTMFQCYIKPLFKDAWDDF